MVQPDTAAVDAAVTQASLFERIGGDAAVDAAVDKFYVKILADPVVGRFFANTDMKQQHVHQKTFMATAFGKKQGGYKGRKMRAAHEKCADGKPPTEEHFGIVAKHLASTLEELSVPKELIDEVMTIVGSTHDDVLCL